jgi:hypothetical protein
MFDKREYRMYQGVKRDLIYSQIFNYWTRHGFHVTQISPFHIQGESYQSNIGLRREFYLRLDEYGDSTYIDLTFRARVTDTGAVGGVAAAVIFWPAAVVGGALSYSEFEKDANSLIYHFWGYVDKISNQRGSVPSYPAHFAPPPPPPPQYQHPPPQYLQPQEIPQPTQLPSKQTSAIRPKKKKLKSKKSKPKHPQGDIKEPPGNLKPISVKNNTIPCVDCGASLPLNWKACPYCGKPKD